MKKKAVITITELEDDLVRLTVEYSPKLKDGEMSKRFVAVEMIKDILEASNPDEESITE